MKHLGRKLLVPAVGLAVAGGGFAFLANDTALTNAGGGEVKIVVAGYTIHGVSLNPCDGSNSPVASAGRECEVMFEAYSNSPTAFPANKVLVQPQDSNGNALGPFVVCTSTDGGDKDASGHEGMHQTCELKSSDGTVGVNTAALSYVDASTSGYAG